MDFENINYLAVLVSAIAAFFLGFLWYGPLFGKAWLKELGFNEENTEKPNMFKIFGLSFILMLLAVIGLAMISQGHRGNNVDWFGGLWHGLFAGVLFGIPVFGVNYLFQRRSLKLFLIDALYWIIWLSIAGVILGLWH